MLRVTIPDFKNTSRMISYEAPETAELNIREYIISQYPPEVQLKCKIETISEIVEKPIAPIQLPKEQPKTKERLELEAKANELGIRSPHLYGDDKLKERIELKQSKQPAPEKDGQTITNG